MGQMESPNSWKIVKIGLLEKKDAEPKKGIRSCRAIALTSVMSKWYASCIILRLEKEKNLRKLEESASWRSRWEKLPAFASDDDELTEKTLGMQEERNPTLKHGSAVRPTMYLASLDIKTAFDEAKTKHVAQMAQIFDSHDTHGWLIAALLREMSGLSGTAMFELVESSFVFNRCLRQGSMEAPRLWQKMATQILANMEEEWMKEHIKYGALWG